MKRTSTLVVMSLLLIVPLSSPASANVGCEPETGGPLDLAVLCYAPVGGVTCAARPSGEPIATIGGDPVGDRPDGGCILDAIRFVTTADSSVVRHGCGFQGFNCVDGGAQGSGGSNGCTVVYAFDPDLGGLAPAYADCAVAFHAEAASSNWLFSGTLYLELRNEWGQLIKAVTCNWDGFGPSNPVLANGCAVETTHAAIITLRRGEERCATIDVSIHAVDSAMNSVGFQTFSVEGCYSWTSGFAPSPV